MALLHQLTLSLRPTLTEAHQSHWGAPLQPRGAFTRNADAIRSQHDAKLVLLFCSYQSAVPWLVDNLFATQIAAVRRMGRAPTPLWDEPQDLVSLHVDVDQAMIT